MNTSPLTKLSCLVVLFAILGLSSVAGAQTVGADDYEAPDDGLPGEATTAPPTAQPDQAAVHTDDDTRPPMPDQQPELSEGERTVSVQLSHATKEDIELGDLPVVLLAVRPPGLLQPDNFTQVISSWNAVTDDEGIARFENLPDDLARQGLQLQASTSFGGLAFESEITQPADDIQIALPLYDRTHQLPPIRITKKRVIISPWEEYLVVDQFWTFEIDGDYAFDIDAASDPALERGLPLRLPLQAEGISFAGPGDHQIVNNIVYWSSTLQPDRPVTIQMRFSKSARSSSYTFEQLMHYPVDEVQLLAPIDTPFERIPRLDDLVLRAPGFDVGSDPAAIGLPTNQDYLVASNHSVERGESYTFRVEGLPFSRPFGGWIALFAGLFGILFIAAYGRREWKLLKGSHSKKEMLDALEQRREAVIDELAVLKSALEETEDVDHIFDLEEEQILLRQRLALILRKIDELNAAESTSSQAA